MARASTIDDPSSAVGPLPTPHRVAAMVYGGLAVFEFSILSEVFGRERPEQGWYDFSVCAIEPGPLQTDTGLVVDAPERWDELEAADTIIIPGWRGAECRPPQRAVEVLRRAHGRGGRLVSICSGVFMLAAAGLLNGRRATTHWRYADQLRDLYPDVRVNEDVLYVSDDGIFTSAGSAAGIDLSLHLVRTDFGSAVANQVARRLVVPAHRDGGQKQFIPSPVEASVRDAVGPLLAWIDVHFAEPLALKDLAEKANMSERTLSRRFKERTGLSPARYLTLRRVNSARDLLEESDWSVERISHAVGFGSAQILRTHFRRALGTTPHRYRRSFGLAGGDPE